MTNLNKPPKNPDSKEIAFEYISQLPYKKVFYSPALETQEAEVAALSNDAWECIDGRVEQEGKLRFPGGALGLFFALSAALKKAGVEFDAQDLKNEMENIFGGKLRYHTDDHSLDSELACAGCGHLRLCFENPDKYYLDPEWKKFLPKKEELEQDKQNKVASILTGAHEEEFVIAFTSQEQTKLPKGRLEEGVSFFVVHPAVALETLAVLSSLVSDKLQLNLPENFKQTLQEIVDLHITNTKASLAPELEVIKQD